MSVLLVTYDLLSPGKNYDDLYAALKKYTHFHAMGSVWYLDTYETPAQVRDKLKAELDSNDRLIVFRLHKNWASWHCPNAAKWLHDSARTWD